MGGELFADPFPVFGQVAVLEVEGPKHGIPLGRNLRIRTTTAVAAQPFLGIVLLQTTFVLGDCPAVVAKPLTEVALGKIQAGQCPDRNLVLQALRIGWRGLQQLEAHVGV